jgi:hypothetical protein
VSRQKRYSLIKISKTLSIKKLKRNDGLLEKNALSQNTSFSLWKLIQNNLFFGHQNKLCFYYFQE